MSTEALGSGCDLTDPLCNAAVPVNGLQHTVQTPTAKRPGFMRSDRIDFRADSLHQGQVRPRFPPDGESLLSSAGALCTTRFPPALRHSARRSRTASTRALSLAPFGALIRQKVDQGHTASRVTEDRVVPGEPASRSYRQTQRPPSRGEGVVELEATRLGNAETQSSASRPRPARKAGACLPARERVPWL